ncbi:MAG: hypothetical protein FWE33_04805 [Defluviitaleaceae bacterium]|nr:hypothetical protein [Defluviitaleaceae bacterium]
MSGKSPFLGVYENSSGELIDMFSSQTVERSQIIPKMSPFYGVFLDAQGNKHDLSELGGESGATTTTAQTAVTNPADESPSRSASSQAGINTELTNQITALWELENKLENVINTMTHPASVFNQAFSNATFDGEVNAIDVALNDNITIVSFWGFANQNAAGTAGQDFIVLDPTTYQLLNRFVGQVDQFAIGYNAATNDFKYVPIRITNQGMYIVTAPNISIGTRFSFQFVLILAQTENA